MLPWHLILCVQITSRTMAFLKGSCQEGDNINQYYHRTIGGVQVIDTPLLALDHSTHWAYRLIIRSWLFGALVIDKNATLRESVDLEVHAVAAMMHDIGWDPQPNSPFVNSDKRARWDDRRVHLVWDAIALHATPSIQAYKELGVAVTATGMSADATGPILGITRDHYDTVVNEFPNFDLVDGANKTMIWLCQTKPRTTIDIWVQPWGEYIVPNYTTKGFRTIDQALGCNVPNRLAMPVF
ncbi:unnamed protein product [Clonostachys byssicola]|uniref:HD domain-containing protein n=1 Tax=Clonostachys byssicola TaxID=160290 RepID=A0A9N9U1Q4_9HYPO|nr:unnamed protein product [Clonostachys byssicola]